MIDLNIATADELDAVARLRRTEPGAHPPIIDRALWDAVQQTIARNAVERSSAGNIMHASLLAGILYDGEGRRMSPSHASKGGKRYRYYVTPASELRDGEPPACRVHQRRSTRLRARYGPYSAGQSRQRAPILSM